MVSDWRIRRKDVGLFGAYDAKAKDYCWSKATEYKDALKEQRKLLVVTDIYGDISDQAWCEEVQSFAVNKLGYTAGISRVNRREINPVTDLDLLNRLSEMEIYCIIDEIAMDGEKKLPSLQSML